MAVLSPGKDKGVILVMPRASTAWASAEALWVTAAGWGKAAQNLFGQSWIITSDRIGSPEEALSYVKKTAPVMRTNSGVTSLVPTALKTFIKDMLLLRDRNQSDYSRPPWQDTKIEFVWEQHDLFSGPGWKIARGLNVPLVLYVHAPVVWEAMKWGVARPLWGSLLEKFYEQASLKRATVVCCVSEEVAAEVERMGVRRNCILVSPMAVDLTKFNSHYVGDNPAIRQGKPLVVGWVGSFRGFHGLDKLVYAFSNVRKANEQVMLILVGDGPERARLERKVADLGLSNCVEFTGKVPFTDVGRQMNRFDIAVVSADSASGFHYSPLKLREYLAAHKPTLAPRAGEIPMQFNDGNEVLLFDVASDTDMTQKLQDLIADAGLREKLADGGYNKVRQSGTWEFELSRVMRKLGEIKNDISSR